MKAIKLFGLAAVALLAMVLVGAPSAMAETTALCKEDVTELEGEKCPTGKLITHVHEATLTKAQGKLLSVLTVECEVLFLGDVISENSSGNPLEIEGHLTYAAPGANCRTTGGTNCEVKETSAHALVKVLKLGHELADVTGQAEVNVHCAAFINCTYDGVGLVGHGLGPLLAVEANGETRLEEQVTHKTGGSFCPETAKLDLLTTPLEATYIAHGGTELRDLHKTALCTADETGEICFEEHKPSSIEFKDKATEFLTSLLNSKCEGSVSGTAGAAGKPQSVTGVAFKFSGCTNSCAITEISGGSKLTFLSETTEAWSKEFGSVTTEGLELFAKCGETVKCAFGPITTSGSVLGALNTSDNGHITFSKASLGKGEGLLCPSEASLDALFVASSPTYVREDYAKAPTSLCSKDEGSPACKSENQLKTIDYKDKALELLTNLINVKCEGLASGSVGTPANGSPLEVKPELTFSNCGSSCFVTVVSGPGKVILERLKSEEAKATAEGFEIFVKCGTTIKCLLGPEKMAGTALGALTTGDNGHLTFSKVSIGKGEGATCPTEAKLDTTLIASSPTYIG